MCLDNNLIRYIDKTNITTSGEKPTFYVKTVEIGSRDPYRQNDARSLHVSKKKKMFTILYNLKSACNVIAEKYITSTKF